MRKWGELYTKENVLVSHFSQDQLFQSPYRGHEQVVLNRRDITRMISDGTLIGMLETWEDATDRPGLFPSTFESSRSVKFGLNQINNFDVETKNLNGAKEIWSTTVSCPLVEFMLRDLEILFGCFANDHFPPIWERILAAYLDNGFPCGWQRNDLGEGLIVFSNWGRSLCVLTSPSPHLRRD